LHLSSCVRLFNQTSKLESPHMFRDRFQVPFHGIDDVEERDAGSFRYQDQYLNSSVV